MLLCLLYLYSYAIHYDKNLCKFLFHAYALFAHAPVQTRLRLKHAPAFAGNMHVITKLTQMFYIIMYGIAVQAIKTCVSFYSMHMSYSLMLLCKLPFFVVGERVDMVYYMSI